MEVTCFISIHIYIYIHTYIHIIVELRTPAMPFGLEAFVAVKLRYAKSVIKSPENGRVPRVAENRRADSKHVCAHCQR